MYEHRESIARSHLYFTVTVALGVSLALVVVLYHPQAASKALCCLFLLVCSPVLLGFGKRLRKWFARQDFFSPMVAFPLAYIVWFTIGSINFVELPHSISFGAFDPIPLRILVYAGIGLVGYLVGVCLVLSGSKRALPKKTPHFRNTWKQRVTLVLVGVGLIMAGCFIYIFMHMGITILRPDAAEARLEIVRFHLAATLLSISGYTFFLFALVVLWIGQESARFAKWLPFMAWAIALVVVLLCFANRGGFFIVLLNALILYNYLRRPLKPKNVLLALVAVFALLSVYGYLRDQTVPNRLDEWLADAGVPRAVQPFLYCYLYIRYPVATLRDVAEVIPAQVPYQHGSITLLPFQSLLPGHHEMSDWYFKNLLGNEFLGAGQPATLLGPFYADFGAPGIFVGMLGYGMLLAWLYRWMMKEPTPYSALMFSWTTQVGLFGLFGAAFGDLGAIVVPIGWAVLNLFMSRVAKTQGNLGQVPSAQFS